MKPQTFTSRLDQVLVIEPFWIGLLFPFVIFPHALLPARFHPFVVGALFLFWPIRWGLGVYAHKHRHEQQGRRWKAVDFFLPLQSPASLSILLLLIWTPVNLWASANPENSWITLGYLSYGIAAYVACINSRFLRQWPEALAAVFFTLGMALAVAAPFITNWKAQFRLFYVDLYQLSEFVSGRLPETVHANVLASGLILVFPVACAIALAPRAQSSSEAPTHQPQHISATLQGVPPWMRGAAVLCTLLLLSVIVFTQGRSAYLAVAVSLATIVMLRWPKSTYLLLPIAALIVLAGIQSDLFSTVLERSSSDLLGGWDGRVNIWQNSYRAIQDFAFTGIGIGEFATVMPLLYPIRYDITSYPHAHNLALQIGLDQGIPGLVAYLATLISTISILVEDARHRNRTLGWSIGIGLLSALAAMLVDGLFSTANWGLKLGFLPWIILALAVLLHRQVMDSTESYTTSEIRTAKKRSSV